MRGVHIFEKPCCREIRVMRGRAMRGLPVVLFLEVEDIQDGNPSKNLIRSIILDSEMRLQQDDVLLLNRSIHALFILSNFNDFFVLFR